MIILFSWFVVNLNTDKRSFELSSFFKKAYFKFKKS